MGKTKTPIMLACEYFENRRLEAEEAYKNAPTWTSDARRWELGHIVTKLQSLLPIERQAIVEAFDAGAVKSSFGGFLTPDGKSFYTTKYQSE